MNRHRWLLALVVMAGTIAAQDAVPAADSRPGVVSVDGGRISGRDVGGAEPVRVYQGIPFAAPPTGELRWKAPRPVLAWDGVRACHAFGPSCPQPSGERTRSFGNQDEDCLYLNVWGPVNVPAKPLPVMVWIHGGGFIAGSGSAPFYDGAKFARMGVVLVTINYRLGPLGFLAHPALSKESPDGVSGNYGLMDQIAALRWVQRNIAAFGGDPGNVTIFGESAGAVSVGWLMSAPSARGLFHRAIAESGTARGPARSLRENLPGRDSMESVGQNLARELSISEGPDELARLRRVPADELIRIARPTIGRPGDGTRFGPVVDGRLVPDQPSNLLAAGRVHVVPMILGSNAHDGSVFAPFAPVKSKAAFDLMVRGLFPKAADTLLGLYPIESETDVRARVTDFITDMAFIAPARATARDLVDHGGQVWVYHFSRTNRIAERRLGQTRHGAEIPYVFGLVRDGLIYDTTDVDLSRAMMSYWVNFAKVGDPNGGTLPIWPRYERATDKHMEFAETPRVGEHLRADRCDLLDRR